MKITRGLDRHQPTPYPVLTIGNFDGQHKGHQSLLRQVVERADEKQGTPMVLTLDPHPVKVLAPHVEFRLLTSQQEKLKRCEQAGIQEILFLPFDKALAELSPEEFVCTVLRDGVGVKELFVGSHFAFGKGRAGTISDLHRLGKDSGFIVHAVNPLVIEGQVVSSTRIRGYVKAGDVQAAEQCLGRPYTLEGIVMAGEQRGRELGWPTANLPLSRERVIPADGVYATITVWNQRRLASVSYIGTRPTFGGRERLLEVYVLDEQVQLYGEPILVEFVKRIRGDIHFESSEALGAQIANDVVTAREAFRLAEGKGAKP